MGIVHILALLGGVMNIWSFWQYNRSVFWGGTRPNAATWFLWASVTAVQVFTYKASGNLWSAVIVMATDSSLCVLTLGFLWWKGRFGGLDRREWMIVGLSLAAIVVWLATSSATLGNIISQVPYALAFLPTLRDSWKGKTDDDPIIWEVFTASFVVALIVTSMVWTEKTDFLSPIVAIIMHGALAYCAVRNRRLRTKTSAV